MKKFICLLLSLVLLLQVGVVFAEDFDGEVMGIMKMEGEFLNGDILKVSVTSEDMLSPVLGLAFYLSYEKEKLAFLKYEPGKFLERGGDPFYLVQKKEAEGRLIFGETLRRDDDFPIGGDIVADFYFQILRDEEFEFGFSNGVVSTLNVVRQDLDKIVWEDAMFERSAGEDTVFSSVLGSRDKANFPAVIPLFLVGLAILSAGVLIFFFKKQENKRPETSVNFK